MAKTQQEVTAQANQQEAAQVSPATDKVEDRPAYEGVSFSYLDLLKGKIPDASRQ